MDKISNDISIISIFNYNNHSFLLSYNMYEISGIYITFKDAKVHSDKVYVYNVLSRDFDGKVCQKVDVIRIKCQLVNSCPSETSPTEINYTLLQSKSIFAAVSMPLQLTTYFTSWKIIEINYLRNSGRRISSGHCTTDQLNRQLLLLLGLFGGLYAVNRAGLGLIPAALGGSVLTQELPWTGFAFARVLCMYH